MLIIDNVTHINQIIFLTNISLSVVKKTCSAVVLLFSSCFFFIVALKRYLNVFFQENRSGIKIKDKQNNSRGCNRARSFYAVEFETFVKYDMLSRPSQVSERDREGDWVLFSIIIQANIDKCNLGYAQVNKNKNRDRKKQNSVGQIQLVKLQRNCSA